MISVTEETLMDFLSHHRPNGEKPEAGPLRSSKGEKPEAGPWRIGGALMAETRGRAVEETQWQKNQSWGCGGDQMAKYRNEPWKSANDEI